jgi:hypothetical protein
VTISNCTTTQYYGRITLRDTFRFLNSSQILFHETKVLTYSNVKIEIELEILAWGQQWSSGAVEQWSTVAGKSFPIDKNFRVQHAHGTLY